MKRENKTFFVEIQMIIFVTLKGFVGNLSKEKKENYSFLKKSL